MLKNVYWNELMMVVLCSIAACNDRDSHSFVDDLDLTTFMPLVEIENMDFTNISPSAEVEYFELRTEFAYDESHEYSVVNQHGTLCQAAEDVDQCLKAFESTLPQGGFCIFDHPADQWYYLAVQSSLVNETIDSVAGVADFLGAIDTAEDALLFVRANCYFWRAGHVEAGGIRQVANGFEVIAIELVSLCTPLQSDRVLLHINTDGVIVELDREVYSKKDDMCS
ncbi:MAG: hypothetical protein QNJ97_19610 [Myxococcota bacterium]|nr:hypothetical protein [Myxococcota bacterium]